jgi:hypothetical protein
MTLRYADMLNLVDIFLLACSETSLRTRDLPLPHVQKRLCSRISKVQQDRIDGPLNRL